MPDPFAHCETLVRAGDRDRFLTTLFAPVEHRAAMNALYALNLEIARIRELVRNPLAGEIRLQWWSDVLDEARSGADGLDLDLGSGAGGGGQGHPVAAALLAIIAKYGLERNRILDLIDARRFDQHDEPMLTQGSYEVYADATSGNLIVLCSQILAGGASPGIEKAAHHAGFAHATAGLLNAFPQHARRGQLYVPLDVLQRHGSGQHDIAQGLARGHATAALHAALAELRVEARRHLDRARALTQATPAVLIPAFLPAALVRVTLARMERPNYDPFQPIEIAPWRRQWIIWRAARKPTRIFG